MTGDSVERIEEESLPPSSTSPRPSTPPAPPPRRRNSTVVKDLVDDALVKVDALVVFQWQLLQRVYRRRGSSGFNTRLVCRASFNRAEPFCLSPLF
ncbi:hypothetical protein JCM10049v2_007170 [Rhodotorula toruloides]